MSRTTGHRDLDTGSPWAHVTAAVPFHRGILHVEDTDTDIPTHSADHQRKPPVLVVIEDREEVVKQNKYIIRSNRVVSKV